MDSQRVIESCVISGFAALIGQPFRHRDKVPNEDRCLKDVDQGSECLDQETCCITRVIYKLY